MKNDTKQRETTVNSRATSGRGVRFTDEVWTRLERVADHERIQTGNLVNVSDVIRKFTMGGLLAWEREHMKGALVTR